MRRRIVLFALATSLVLTAQAAQAGVGPENNPYDTRMKFLRGVRDGVVLLRTRIGVASGTVLDAGAGLVACAKSSLESAGRIEAFYFKTHIPERGPDHVERVGLGEAEVVAIHRSADAALLRVKLHPGTVAFPLAPVAANQGAPVAVLGVQGAAPFDEAGDLEVRRGALGAQDSWEPDRVPLTAPTHLNSAGGAVLLKSGALYGVASFDLPEGFVGAAVPYRHFLDLREKPGDHALPVDEAAEFVRLKDGSLPHWPLSSEPGGPEGKRVPFGRGVAAVKEPRVVLAEGIFVLDRDEPLEYFACPLERGKLHETVIVVDADAGTLNFALMALKYKSGGGVKGLGDPRVPRGERVSIHVEWDAAEARAIREWLLAINPSWKRPDFRGVREKVNEGAIKWKPGPIVRVRAEYLMFNARQGHPMVRTDWVYSGSRFTRDEETGKYLFHARLDGVLAAVYRDPSAMFNIPLRTGEDDTYYCVRGSVTPPRGTKCLVIFAPPADGSEGGRGSAPPAVRPEGGDR